MTRRRPRGSRTGRGPRWPSPARADRRAPTAEVVEAAEHLQILPSAQFLVDRGVLAEQPDAVADLVGVAQHVVPGDLGTAAVVAQQAWPGSVRRWSCPHR